MNTWTRSSSDGVAAEQPKKVQGIGLACRSHSVGWQDQVQETIVCFLYKGETELIKRRPIVRTQTRVISSCMQLAAGD